MRWGKAEYVSKKARRQLMEEVGDPCEVYFIFARDADGPMYVKVGVSAVPESRMQSVQTGCPMQIKRVISFECKHRRLALAAERAIHQHLERRHSWGEWFRFDWDAAAKDELNATIDGAMQAARGEILREIDMETCRAVARIKTALRVKDTREWRDDPVAKYRKIMELRTQRFAA